MHLGKSLFFLASFSRLFACLYDSDSEEETRKIPQQKQVKIPVTTEEFPALGSVSKASVSASSTNYAEILSKPAPVKEYNPVTFPKKETAQTLDWAMVEEESEDEEDDYEEQYQPQDQYKGVQVNENDYDSDW